MLRVPDGKPGTIFNGCCEAFYWFEDPCFFFVAALVAKARVSCLEVDNPNGTEFGVKEPTVLVTSFSTQSTATATPSPPPLFKRCCMRRIGIAPPASQEIHAAMMTLLTATILIHQWHVDCQRQDKALQQFHGGSFLMQTQV